MFIASGWKDYEVIDTGDGEKLERWNDIILRRPDPHSRAVRDLLYFSMGLLRLGVYTRIARGADLRGLRARGLFSALRRLRAERGHATSIPSAHEKERETARPRPSVLFLGHLGLYPDPDRYGNVENDPVYRLLRTDAKACVRLVADAGTGDRVRVGTDLVGM